MNDSFLFRRLHLIYLSRTFLYETATASVVFLGPASGCLRSGACVCVTALGTLAFSDGQLWLPGVLIVYKRISALLKEEHGASWNIILMI